MRRKILRKKTIRELKNLAGKTVFVTADFNLSLKDGNLGNDRRIVETLPTINFLLKKGAKVILASHLGRPKGYDKRLSLRPVAKRLEKLVGRPVHLIDGFWEKKALEEIRVIPKEELILLENIRFVEEEKKNDPEFSRHLASMADIFVNDAFGASHRIHSSIVGIAEFLPAYAGLLLAKEIKVLSAALNQPKRPFLLLIGGAKTPEKISVIERLLEIADTIALGGAIANTFLAAWGFGMGRSLVDYEMVEMARVVFWKAARNHSALLLPVDVVAAAEKEKKEIKIFDYHNLPRHLAIFDIGPKTCQLYASVIRRAKTIIWNGPMGLYEEEKFRQGTDFLLKEIAESRAFSIVGGGDTLNSIRAQNYLEKISHVSTGGSAMLEFLEKGTLPGIEVLKNS